MNMIPDETKLALWLEDELDGAERAAVDAWAGKQPEHVAAREEIRHWRELVRSGIPASEEPPYGEFFNARIARAIREKPAVSADVSAGHFAWRAMWMPLAACAGMVFAFLLGAQSRPGPTEVRVVEVPAETPGEPHLYTPESGVTAERFASSAASATVIVLDGVEPLPDTMDFSETALLPSGPEVEATAEFSSKAIDHVTL